MWNVKTGARRAKKTTKMKSTHFSRLHLLRPFAEGEVRVAGRGAVSPLVFDRRDECTAETKSFSQPVIVDSYDKIFLILQKTLCISHTQNLCKTQKSSVSKLPRSFCV